MITTQLLRKSKSTISIPKRFASARVIHIDFKDVVNQEKSLFPKFEEAFGDDGVGACIVNNIPAFSEKRRALLPFAQKITKLEKEVLETLESPELLYGVGWSHGREKFQGKPDFLKASYYACPLSDSFKMNFSETDQREANNLWPAEGVLDGFETAFKDLGQFINSVGLEVGKNLDKYVKHRAETFEEGLIYKHLENSVKTTGRLLHYFPVTEEVDMSDMKWCGWHNDHGTLTGLCSAMYLDKDLNEIDSGEVEDDVSGLFAMTRNHEEVKIKIPQNSLAFQIGETAQIVSGGILCATPHSVVSKPSTEGISRNTFALFLEPNSDTPLYVPQETNPKAVHKKDPTQQVPLIENRWEVGNNFGEFERKTFQKYYEHHG